MNSEADFVVLAFPCEAWSQMQNMNLKLPGYSKALERRRTEALPIPRVVEKVCSRQALREKHFLVENPLSSQAWKQKPMQELTNYSHAVRLHQCAFGLAHPSTGLPIRKPTRLQVSSSSAAKGFVKDMFWT